MPQNPPLENEPCQTCFGHEVIDDPDAPWYWPWRVIPCPECAVTISRAEYDRLLVVELRSQLLESLHGVESFIDRHIA